MLLFELRLLNASAAKDKKNRTAEEWVKDHKLVAAINASMFATDHKSSVALMQTKDHVNNKRLSKDNVVLAFDPLEKGVPAVQIIDRTCRHGLAEITQIFSEGVKIEVGDMLPSSHYAQLLKRVPPVWDKAFEVNASQDEAVRASCVEFVLAGLYATDRISRSQQHGRIVYEV